MKATFYAKTGYNAANGPVSPDVLKSFQQFEITIDDLYDLDNLTELRIPTPPTPSGNLSNWKIVDYVKISGNGTYYYAITDRHFTSADIVSFTLVLDPFMTDSEILYDSRVDGINLHTSGIITRTNSPIVLDQPVILDDIYSLSKPPQVKSYTPADAYPALNPNDARALVGLTSDPDRFDDDTIVSVVREVASDFDVVQDTGIYPKTTRRETYPSPEIRATPGATQVTAMMPFVNGSSTQIYETRTMGYCLYDYLSYADRIQRMHAAGLNNFIVKGYVIDTSLVEVTNEKGRISKLSSRPAQAIIIEAQPDGLGYYVPWAYLAYACKDYTVRISNALSGESLTDCAVNCRPVVYTFIDPRPDGRPYFFLPESGRESTDVETSLVSSIQTRCIKGATWQQVPVVLEGGSGAAAASLRMNTNANRLDQDVQIAEYSRGLGGLGSVGKGVIGYDEGNAKRDSSFGWNPMTLLQNAASFAGETFVNIAGGYIGGNIGAAMSPSEMARLQAGRTMVDEAMAYASSYVFKAPTVISSPSEGLQQLVPNNVVVTVTYPSEYDMMRFGEIYAMFGRSCSIPYRPGAASTGKDGLTIPTPANGTFVQMRAMGTGGYYERLKAERLAIGYRFWKTSAIPANLDPNDFFPKGGND